MVKQEGTFEEWMKEVEGHCRRCAKRPSSAVPDAPFREWYFRWHRSPFEAYQWWVARLAERDRAQEVKAVVDAMETIIHAYVREVRRGARRTLDPEEQKVVKRARAALVSMKQLLDAAWEED